MKHGKLSYKQKLAFALSTAICSQYAAAQVSNGDFENWQQNQPTGWTTIDSGIAVSATSNIVKTGQTAAQVTVTTGTQSSTDLQQLVAVQAGQTYTFSTWVYHTEEVLKHVWWLMATMAIQTHSR